MPGSLQIKLIIAAIFLTLLLSCGGVAWYYHGQYVDQVAKLATTEQALEATQRAAKECSDNTQTLVDQAQLKQKEVEKAQADAAIAAKVNKSKAAQILSQSSTNPNRCEAALDLIFQDKGKK